MERLSILHLAGCMVTLYAIDCQKAIARYIGEQKTDYVLCIRANQQSRHDHIKDTWAQSNQRPTLHIANRGLKPAPSFDSPQLSSKARPHGPTASGRIPGRKTSINVLPLPAGSCRFRSIAANLK